MQRHIDEDETPAVTRQRNRAADARHGFGSPEGMELTDRVTEQGGQLYRPFMRSNYRDETKENRFVQSLVDLDSPPPIQSLSTESETPTPPALSAHSDRQSPPDMADQLVNSVTVSPPRQTPVTQAIKPPPVSSRRRRGDQSVTFETNAPSFVSPTASNISATSSANIGTPTFRPNSFLSPLAVQTTSAARSITSVGSVDPIQMGTPRSAVSGGSGFRGRFSDVMMTPERGREIDDSTSDSDTSVKEPFSDQVKSLNKLLLSTGKRLGALGQTNWTPDKDNDDLTKEEEDLEEIRRQLQEELSMVDFSVLKDSPNSGSTSSGPKTLQEIFPDDEHSAFLSRESTPERVKIAASRTSPDTLRNSIESPRKRLSSAERNRSPPSDHFSTPSATPSSTYSTSQIPSPWSPSNIAKQTATPSMKHTSDSAISQLTTPPGKSTQCQNSPPSTVLVAIQDPQQKNKESPTSKTRDLKTPDAKLSPPTSLDVLQNRSSPTEISTTGSNQSRSSGSSGRSSKSLLERLGFRSSPAIHSKARRDHNNPSSGDLEGATQPGQSGNVSFSNDGADQEDMMSTSASEDSGFDEIHAPDDVQGTNPLPSSVNNYQTKQDSHSRIQPKSSQAETISRMEKQIDASPKLVNPKSLTPHRREVAPEPPGTEPVVHPPNDQTKSDLAVGTLRAQELLDSLDSIFFAGPPTPMKQDTERDPTNSSKPKVFERSHTASSIGTNSLHFPSDEKEFSRESCRHINQDKATSNPSNINVVTMAFPSDEGPHMHKDLFTQAEDLQTFGSPSIIGKTLLPGDQLPSENEAQAMTKSSRHGETTSTEPRKKRRLFGLHVLSDKKPQTMSPPKTPENRGTRLSDSTSLLQNIGSTGSPSGQTLSPIVHEDDEHIELEFSRTDSSPRALFFTASDMNEETLAFHPSKMPLSYCDDPTSPAKDKSVPSRQRKKSLSSKSKICCLFIFIVIGVGVLLSLTLFGVFGGVLEVNSTPTISPSISPTLPSVPNTGTLGPTSSMAPTFGPSGKPEPTISLSPTSLPSPTPSGVPTFFTISFESVYEIIIKDGLVNSVPQENYTSDLIESMDRLLAKILEKLPSESKRLRRRLTSLLLPSSINEIKTVACPEPDSPDKCEKVYAWITLENAKDSWTDFKLFLDLAIAIGQLQVELYQVNPQSPVAIIDMVDDPVPTSAPVEDVMLTTAPSTSPTILTPTEFDLFDLLVRNSFNGGEALMEVGSPQHQAYLWLSENAYLSEYPEDRLLQRYALATFFFSTHGEDWFFKTGWLTDVDECLWYNRSPLKPCNREGQIQNLELEYNNVNGELPPELSLLSNSMERLVLRGGPASSTAGTIPSELGLLTRMTLFSIRGNQFSGSIPFELGQWASLEQFDISMNNLSGQLPPEMGSFTNLTFMDVSDNRLTGQIPVELGNLGRCQQLALENNLLTGPIPSEIGNLRRLQSFHGGSNMFTSLPSELGRLTFLDTLSLFENEIRGTIPSEISRIRRLILLELGDNALTGTIPSQLGNLFDMRDRIDLSNNHLTGQIPAELGYLTRLRVLELHHNKLSGAIPEEFSGLTRVTTISLESNDLTGVLPYDVCNVFNQTYPSFSADCAEFIDNCPCCTTCCVNEEGCACRYIGTPQEFLCFQQKKN